MTKIFHPNVGEGDQHACINLLNNWTLSRTIEDVILGIIEIMINPTTNEAYDNETSRLLGSDSDVYYDKVEEYTYNYAKNEVY